MVAVPEITCPKGYKQTEVGVIPEDWRVLPLEEVAQKGGLVRGPFGGTLKKEIFVTRGYKVYEQRNAIYRITEVGDYFIDPKMMKALIRFQTQSGDMIVSCSGTIGCIYEIPFDAPEGVINQALLKITLNNQIINSDFFLSIFRWERFQYLIAENTHGGAMQNLVGMEVFKRTPVPVPTKREQVAIAEALSDADALIESLEQLIAKKRNIKQGAMQELLSGKKRLPGFSGELEVRQIGELLSIKHGKSHHSVEDRNGDFPILATSGQIGTANEYLYDKPSVLIGRKGTIDRPQYMAKPFWTIDTLFYSVVHEPNNPKYLFYQFCLIDWKQFNEASGVPSLNARTIEQIELKVVLPTEQMAIAEVISDMDDEITALESKLAKARQIKQGMMHNLLTGRIRLV